MELSLGSKRQHVALLMVLSYVLKTKTRVKMNKNEFSRMFTLIKEGEVLQRTTFRNN